MRKWLLLCAAALFALVPTLTAAQGASATKKVLSASGTVSAVSASSLTVKGKADEWTFTIDNDTKVTGKGASTKTAALKDEKKPPVITEFVKVGDSVTVKYHDMGATKHAADVRVTASKPAPK